AKAARLPNMGRTETRSSSGTRARNDSRAASPLFGERTPSRPWCCIPVIIESCLQQIWREADRQLALWHRAHDAVDHAAVLDHDHRGNAERLEALRECRILVHVDLHDLEAT